MIKKKKSKHPERTAKVKLKSITSLKKKLDALFSEFIRRKYSDDKGCCSCYTCGTKLPWKQMQNGHFYSRRHHSLRWDERNCRPQDARCNIFNQGNAPAFAMRLLRENGQEWLEQLEQDKNKIIHLDRVFYDSKIEEYEKKLKEL